MNVHACKLRLIVGTKLSLEGRLVGRGREVSDGAAMCAGTERWAGRLARDGLPPTTSHIPARPVLASRPPRAEPPGHWQLPFRRGEVAVAVHPYLPVEGAGEGHAQRIRRDLEAEAPAPRHQMGSLGAVGAVAPLIAREVQPVHRKG